MASRGTVVIAAASMMLASWLPARAQEDDTAGVAPSAVEAVKKLGEQVVLGHRQFAVERMYPRWKARMAKRMGGMDVLERKLKEQLEMVDEQMRLHGMSMISFEPVGAPKVYGVWPGKKLEMVDGQEVEVLVSKNWLVLIPTVTKFRVIEKETGKPRFIESSGFQVAVSDKGANDWYFMDGGTLSVADLRSLFPDLPENIELPKLERREVP